MAIINEPTSTLQTIINKVRRITRTPSTQQLTDQEIGDYINTFVLYDFPDMLKLFDFKTTFTWYCKPYVDQYELDQSVLPVDDPLYNFQNLYSSISQPIYIAGYQSYYSQSREEFYNLYPLNNSIEKIAQGDGVTAFYTGTLTNVPVLAGNVLFSSRDANNRALSVRDQPANPFDGQGDLIDTEFDTVIGSINYITGAYSVTFNSPPDSGADVDVQTRPYQPSRPTALLFYGNKFTLRPVPDQPYAITMDVVQRPTALLDTATSVPELNDFWQYIAWGAAKKIFEDRMDMENVQKLMPAFKEQQSLVLSKTVMLLQNERTPTIYTQQSSLGASPFFYGGNGNSF